MAKDRFSNQKKNNYQKSYIKYTPVVKRGLVFNREQKKYLKNFISKYKKYLSEWEFEFVLSMSTSATYSEKQRDILRSVCKKYLGFQK